MERMYLLPNHFSPEATHITSAQAQCQSHAQLQRSLGKVLMCPGGKETGSGELKVVPAMEMHRSKSLKLTQIKPVHLRAEYLESSKWALQNSFSRTARSCAPGLNRDKRETLGRRGDGGGFHTDVCQVPLRSAAGA